MDKPREIIIEPGRSIRNYWGDLWHCRELFLYMAWRDLLLRYKHLSIGFAWAILRPFLTMLILTLIFSRLAKLPSAGVPYSLLVYVGMLPWQFFATAFTDAGNSLTNKENIIAKIYFPRLIIPASAVLGSLVDFLAACSVLIGMMIWYRIVPDWRLVAFPLLVMLVLTITLGAGFWISALAAKYKDFRYVIPFMVQVGLYISPIGFHAGIVPEKWLILYSLNPMVGVIEGFRWSVLGIETQMLITSIQMSCATAGLLLISGFYYFRGIERSLAEIL